MYQYILFDLDGTLTDPREGITKSVQYALDKMGISEPDLSALEHFIGPPLYDEFRRCYQMDKAVEAYRERFGVIGWQENILFDGVPELLAALRNAGRKIAIASSKPPVFVQKILHMFEIERYFDVVSGASLDGSIGTKAQVVQQALAAFSVSDLKTAVLVGDRFHDVEGARACGLDCIGLTLGFGGRVELETAGASAVVDSLEELRGVLLAG